MAGIPKTMRAAAIDRFGGPEELTIHTLPVPEIGTRELLIAVHTAGVGSWDADIRAGWWPEGRPKFPLVLGTAAPAWWRRSVRRCVGSSRTTRCTPIASRTRRAASMPNT